MKVTVCRPPSSQLATVMILLGVVWFGSIAVGDPPGRKGGGKPSAPVVTVENFKSWTEGSGQSMVYWTSWDTVTRFPAGGAGGAGQTKDPAKAATPDDRGPEAKMFARNFFEGEPAQSPGQAAASLTGVHLGQLSRGGGANTRGPPENGSVRESLKSASGLNQLAPATTKPVPATADDYLNPKPNTLYESNGYLYRTDAGGRLVEASGQLRLNTAPRNQHRQANVGQSSSTEGDEGGHMIGAQFDGLGEGPLHLVPQAMKLNRGKGSKWTAMEREWARALSRGDDVRVKIEVEWRDGAKRPEGFSVKYEITNSKSGITTTPVEQYFPNS